MAHRVDGRFTGGHDARRFSYSSPRAQIEANIERIPFTTCWIWTGATCRSYGQVRVARKAVFAHRASYEAFKGPIPDGLVVDHNCREHMCVNPEHLEAVSHGENIRRGYAAKWPKRGADITHCPKGHAYTQENTRMQKGCRHCKECDRARNRDYCKNVRRKQ